MLTILLIIFLSFVCLVTIAIKYDSIIPPVARVIKKPRVYISLLVLIIVFVLMQDWGTTMIAAGAESSEKYGFPTPISVMVLVSFLAVGFSIYLLVRTVKKADDKPNQKICTTCKEIFEPYVLTSEVCPKCSGKIEDIAGLFDRNPDFLNKGKET